MNINAFSKFIGWLGFSFGLFVSVPQIIKICKAKSAKGVSRTTYCLILIVCSCYTVRSIVIKEYIFIFSNTFQIMITLLILYLIRKYRRAAKEKL